MKKWYAILLLLSALKVSAQEISFIPEVGLGLSNITNSDNNSKVRPGFNIGMGMEVIWNERVGMGIGVNYLVLGNRFTTDYISYTTKLDYVSIPVYAKGYVYKGLVVFAGPQFGFNVVRDDGRDYDELSDLDKMRKFDFSIGVGIGYQWDFGLQLSASHNLGLIDVWKKYPDEWSSSGKKYNSIFQFNVGWRIGF